MAGWNETGDNKLYIENTNSSEPLIGGDFSTDEVIINGSLSIKDGTQGDGKVLVSDANGKASWGSVPQQDKVMVLSPINFGVEYSDAGDFARNYNSFYIYSGIDGNAFMAINLPEGAYLDHIDIYYIDNSSSDDLYFGLFKTNLTDGNFTISDSYTTSGSSASIVSHTLYANDTVSTGYSFSVVVRGTPWGGYNTRVVGVKVYYKE